MIKNKSIDNGREFDWGRTSEDYAKYRDIYPEEFYKRLLDKVACMKGQTVLDIGTGTGVIPRNMYRYGADFTGIDISAEQIGQAKALAEESGMKIEFCCVPAEESHFMILQGRRLKRAVRFYEREKFQAASEGIDKDTGEKEIIMTWDARSGA